MGILGTLRAWLNGRQRKAQRRESKPRYDNVQVTNLADGTTIKGHSAVKAYFEKEKELLDKHSSSIIFQAYRINLGAKTIEDLRGEKLTEIKVAGGFVSGTDTVVEVKKKMRLLLDGTSQSRQLNIGEADRATLFFNGRLMRDNKMFYADHFIMLPAWVQVYLHECEFEEVAELERRLRLKASAQGTYDE